MNFNMLDAVAAGTGFVQGQDQQHQIDMQNQQQQALQTQQRMALLMNQMKLQDEQKNLGYAQGESAYAKQLATDPDTMDLPVDKKMDLMANSALKQGDLVRANEFAVNATNFRNTQAQVDERKAQAQAKIEASQMKLHNWMGNDLATAADPALGGSEAKFNQAKMQAISEGMGTPQDIQNLTNLKWDPGLADRLRYGAMTAREAMETKQGQQRINIDAKNKSLLEDNREWRQKFQEQKEADDVALKEAKEKAGADKPITKEEMEQALPYMKDLGIDPKDASTVEGIQQDIVSNARQLLQANKNMSRAQAYAEGARLAQQDLHQEVIPSKVPDIIKNNFNFEVLKDKSKNTLKLVGTTPDSPIPWNGKKEDLIPGRWYRGADGVRQFTGTGWSLEVH